MKKIYEDIKKIFESKVSTKVLVVIGVVIVALLIFYAGVAVGFLKASFAHNWEENYERNFGMRPDSFMFGKDNFPNAHGAIGKVIKIELPTIIVQGIDNTEKVVLINDDTQIQKIKEVVTAPDLKIDDSVVVIGTPNAQGQIEAKLIRIMPLGMPAPLGQMPAPTK